MCGIVGYVGKRDAVPVLIDSLKRLEYRGYDSAGIAFRNGKGIEIWKTKGKINDLQMILPNPVYGARIGLGHTRWATHGAPSTRNAHPHSAGGVTVVHNGIIENYRELRSGLIAEGCAFSSDTDTEVVPHLISKNLGAGLSLKDAIQRTISSLRGTFALGIISEADPDALFAVRQGSPLVIGFGEDEFFFASDIPAILPYSRRVMFLENGHLCVLRPGGLELECVLDRNEKISVEDRIIEIDWTSSMAEKEGYDHFMLKEIYEQPRTVKETFTEWVKDPQRLLDASGLPLEITLGLRRLQIVACGTSWHAALIGKHLIESLARVPVDIDIASEYRYRKPIVEKGTILMSITQSGETADTLAAQREAKHRGATTLTICNVVGSSSSREADSVLYTRAGPEIGVASTKAFTAQITALYLLAVALAMRKGKLSLGETNNLKAQFALIPNLIDEALKKDGEIKELARSLIYAKSFLYLGRGINYPIALEGALKLKEVSYIHAEGYPAGEMKHGPIALIDEGMPVVVVAPKDDLFEKILSNIEEVKARGGRVIAVSDDAESLAHKADNVIAVPATHHTLSPLVNIIPLQLLAYHVAVLRGCNVDQPRNLAKSVTVE
ncbi:MAG TPA: glutamine--fructose-6-phosphate transaminase (isomerizing) [Thermodesulfovibrionales bacterium]|jgi:glucosamine--fructose-6-phosphate aminotransferase (isomerizing)|nr:glutamine--fructose-6-phosphate transaminase (isomerizing) [Thermodesulfovibrionales bacterium]